MPPPKIAPAAENEGVKSAEAVMSAATASSTSTSSSSSQTPQAFTAATLMKLDVWTVALRRIIPADIVKEMGHDIDDFDSEQLKSARYLWQNGQQDNKNLESLGSWLFNVLKQLKQMPKEDIQELYIQACKN